jgi:phage tail-like protein
MNLESVARDVIRAIEGPDARQPLQVFKFKVNFSEASFAAPGGADSVPLAQGSFAEISGLEASIEPKTIREGGLNTHQHQRVGARSHATVVMRRGMARVHELHRWFEVFTGGQYGARLDVEIELLGTDGSPQLRCALSKAMPVRYRAADFNARNNEVGIEELHLVHEGLAWSAPAESSLAERLIGAAMGIGAQALGGSAGAALRGGVRL